MADETCPLCEGQGKGLPGYFGTMADMFTLLFAFFVLMFSMATMDPAKISDAGGDDIGGAKEEEMEQMIEEIKKQAQELKEQGVTEIDDQPIEEYMDSLIQDLKTENESPPKSYEIHGDLAEIDDQPIEEYMDSLIQEMKDESKPPPKKYEIHGDFAEIFEEMELDSSEAKVDINDVRGMVIELNGGICFDALSAKIKPKLKQFLDAAADSFLTVPSDNRQIIIEGHSDNNPIPKQNTKQFPSNWELSSARSSSVVKYLIEKGVNPARLVAHGYADRWPADMAWADMRRGSVARPIGDNITIETGRSGVPNYKGVERDERGIPLLENISMDTVIDSLNSTIELRRRNRRIKIIITEQPLVDGPERSGNIGK